MATRLPGIKQAEKLSSVLQDIGNRMERIHSLSDFEINLNIEGLDATNRALAEQYRQAYKLRRLWPEYSRNIAAIVDQKKQAVAQLAALTNKLEQLKKRQGDWSDEEHRQFKALQEEITRTQGRIVALNSKTKESQAFWSALANTVGRRGAAASLKLLAAGVTALTAAITSGYDMQERWRKSFAGMAKTMGAFTPQLGVMQKTASRMYRDGTLGKMGMSLEEITGQMSSFAESLGIMDESMIGDSEKLVTYSQLLGRSGQEMGEFARSMMLMGENAASAEKTLEQIAIDAKKLNISSNLLSRNVLTLGRNLMMMLGPKFKQQAQDAITLFTKIGISVQSLEGFTKMTNRFGQSADAMARLNTTFGTHVSALDMLLERDPAKRFEEITRQLRMQGITSKNVSQGEIEMLSETVGLTVEETHAMLRYAEAGKSVAEEMKRRQGETAQWNTAMNELRTTLITFQRIFDKVMLAGFKLASPVFKKIGLDFDNLGSGIQGITQIAGRFEQALEDMFDNMDSPKYAKMRGAFERIGEAIGGIIEDLLEFIQSDKFPAFLQSMVIGVSQIAKAAGMVVSFFGGPFGTIILGILGKILEFSWLIAGSFATWKIAGAVKGNLAAKAAELAGQAAGIGGSGVAGSLAKGGGGMLAKFGGKIGGVAGGVGSMGAGLVGGVVGDIGSNALGVESSAVGGGIGGTIGMLIGGAIGSFIAPGVGTVIGAGIGSALGTMAGNFVASKVGDEPEARALGGPVAAAAPYLVGEHGPELFVPQTNGQIVPNNGMQPVVVQVYLDGEKIFEQVTKNQLRRQG